MFPVCEKFGNNRRPPCPAAGASPSPFSLFSLLLPHFRVFLAEGSCRTSPPWPESRGWDSSTPARFPNQSSFPAVPPTRSARSFFSCSRAALAQFYHLHICAPAAPTPSGINRPREGIIRVMLNCCHTPGLPPCLINSSNYSIPPAISQLGQHAWHISRDIPGCPGPLLTLSRGLEPPAEIRDERWHEQAANLWWCFYFMLRALKQP